MNTTPVRTGGSSWIFVTELEALPMGELGLSIPGNSGLLWGKKMAQKTHLKMLNLPKNTELPLKSLEKNVPAAF